MEIDESARAFINSEPGSLDSVGYRVKYSSGEQVSAELNLSQLDETTSGSLTFDFDVFMYSSMCEEDKKKAMKELKRKKDKLARLRMTLNKFITTLESAYVDLGGKDTEQVVL